MKPSPAEKAIAEAVGRQGRHDFVLSVVAVMRPLRDADGAMVYDFTCSGCNGTHEAADTTEYRGKALIRPFFGTPVVVSCELSVTGHGTVYRMPSGDNSERE